MGTEILCLEFECLRDISCGKDTDHSALIRKLKRSVKTTLGNFGIFEIFRGINQQEAMRFRS